MPRGRRSQTTPPAEQSTALARDAHPPTTKTSHETNSQLQRGHTATRKPTTPTEHSTICNNRVNDTNNQIDNKSENKVAPNSPISVNSESVKYNCDQLANNTVAAVNDNGHISCDTANDQHTINHMSTQTKMNNKNQCNVSGHEMPLTSDKDDNEEKEFQRASQV